MKRPHIPKAFDEEMWRHVGGRCRICGKQLKKSAKQGEYGRWHRGHIRAHSKGGKTEISNLLPTCRDCNLILKDSNSKRIKKVLRLGVYAEEQIRTNTNLGKQLKALYAKRRKVTVSRRKP